MSWATTRLQFEVAPVADVLGNNQTDAFAGVDQSVGDDLDLEEFAVLVSMQPKAVLLGAVLHLANVGHRFFALGVGADGKDGHVLKFFVGITVELDGGLIDAEKLERLHLIQPGGHGVVLKEEAQDGFILAKLFLGAAALDGQGDVAADGIEEFEVAEIICVFVLVVLNDEDPDGGGRRLERDAEPGGRGRAD